MPTDANDETTSAGAAAAVAAPDDALRRGIGAEVTALRDSFEAGTTRGVTARLDQLAALHRGLRAERRHLTRALTEDLGKSRTESVITELGVLLQEITHVRRHLRSWLRPRSFSPGMMLAPAQGRIVREPLGVALIIAPWNYPLNLTISPLIGAIAGGNTAVLKPSETAPATSAALARLARTHLDPEWVRVIEGTATETTALLEQRFDLIFYTGGAAVGRIVARAAAEHLTPTILELGGKTPAFVDDDVDLRTTARRIVWGKFTNTGQTCVAPDHLLATEETVARLLPHLRRAVREMYGADPQRARDYGRMVDRKQFDRVLGLVDDEKAVLGGTAAADRDRRYLPPTIMTGVTDEDAVMAEEVFGPVLPILAVDGPQEAITRIRAGDKPLTAYVFTGDRDVEERFAAETSSGSLAVGLTLAHLGSPSMPFGGVGASGMGAYHGRASVDAFTHAKPVVRKPLRPDTLRLVYPPYRGPRKGLIARLLR